MQDTYKAVVRGHIYTAVVRDACRIQPHITIARGAQAPQTLRLCAITGAGACRREKKSKIASEVATYILEPREAKTTL